jgi:hypothetical protein
MSLYTALYAHELQSVIEAIQQTIDESMRVVGFKEINENGYTRQGAEFIRHNDRVTNSQDIIFPITSILHNEVVAFSLSNETNPLIFRYLDSFNFDSEYGEIVFKAKTIVLPVEVS